MKNYLLALLLLAAIPMANAQDDEIVRPLRLGLKIAPNLGWISPNSNDLQKDGAMLRPGFGFGLMTEFSIVQSPNYYFSTGFELTTNGGKLFEAAAQEGDTTNAFALGRVKRSYALRYVTIPVAIKMRTNEIGRNYYYGLFGGSLGFNINAIADDEYTWTNSTTQATEQEDIDIGDDVRLFRAEMLVGAGIELPISGNTKATAGITWHNGFTNVFSGRSLTPNTDGNATIDPNTGLPAEGTERQAMTNYLSLDIGIFF